AVLGSLRRDEPDRERFIGALADAHVHGIPVDWEPLFRDTGARRVELPSYPFERQRYWLEPTAPAAVTAVGQGAADPPLLGAAVALAGEERWLFTGRLSLKSHPWLADHAVFEAVLLPGTAFVEL